MQLHLEIKKNGGNREIDKNENGMEIVVAEQCNGQEFHANVRESNIKIIIKNKKQKQKPKQG